MRRDAMGFVGWNGTRENWDEHRHIFWFLFLVRIQSAKKGVSKEGSKKKKDGRKGKGRGQRGVRLACIDYYLEYFTWPLIFCITPSYFGLLYCVLLLRYDLINMTVINAGVLFGFSLLNCHNFIFDRKYQPNSDKGSCASFVSFSLIVHT